MVQCNTCGGTYEPVQADGMRYFHVCPPLSAPELQAAVDAGKVELPKGETVDDAVSRRTYRRANHRDETVVPATDRTTAGRPKSIGLGVTELEPAPDPIIQVP